MAKYRTQFGATAPLIAKLERQPAVDKAPAIAGIADERHYFAPAFTVKGWGLSGGLAPAKISIPPLDEDADDRRHD